MRKKYRTSKALSSSFSGKVIASYLRGARFKSYLQPSTCTQCHCDLGLFIFIFTSIREMCVDPQFLTFSRTRHATSRHPPPPNRTSSGMCQEEKSDVEGSKVVGV